MRKPSVVVGDDHSLVIDGIRKILESEFQLVGVATDGRELLRVAQKTKPDVILLDINMPGLNGIEVARRLRRSVPDSKLIFVTMHSEFDYVREALRLGASGYIPKQTAGSELVSAIHQVLRGQLYVTPLIAKEILSAVTAAPAKSAVEIAPALTTRQREVLRLAALGNSAKEIGHALGISPRTAEFHKSQIMKEVGVHTTAELTRYAIKEGLIQA